jgi:hypothetical protein
MPNPGTENLSSYGNGLRATILAVCPFGVIPARASCISIYTDGLADEDSLANPRAEVDLEVVE